jgi:hypothetical protein
MKRWLLAALLFSVVTFVRVEFEYSALRTPHSALDPEPADLILLHGKVLTVDDKFTIAEALAIKDERIVAVGSDKEVLRFKGQKTRVIDVQGRTVLPGLYDSHTHPVGAATSELVEPLPELRSLDDVFTYIRKKTTEEPEGDWIVLRFAFPTRLKEARFPTRQELDNVAPKHPVLYHAGPAGIVNTMGLKVSGVTKDTKNPQAGVIVRDPKTGEATGMLRNAYGVLKGVPPGGTAKAADRRAAVKKLFRLYNQHLRHARGNHQAAGGAARQGQARRPDGRRSRIHRFALATVDPHRPDQVFPRWRHAQRHRLYASTLAQRPHLSDH